MENLRIEQREDGFYLVCDRGDVAKMLAGYADTQVRDAVYLYACHEVCKQNRERGRL